MDFSLTLGSLELDAVTLGSLGATVAILLTAYLSSLVLLPRNARPPASTTDRLTFVWLVFDALIHFILEGSFLYYSFKFTPTAPFMTVTSGANASKEPLALLWQEYGKADARWGTADPTVISLEILTVFLAAPMCLYIANKIVSRDPARHYWIVVLCTGELYGGWMTFAPEWLTGTPALNTSNWLLLWVYLVFFNMLWVVIPLWLMYDSYGFVSRRLRLADRIGKTD